MHRHSLVDNLLKTSKIKNILEEKLPVLLPATIKITINIVTYFFVCCTPGSIVLGAFFDHAPKKLETEIKKSLRDAQQSVNV